MWRVDNKTRFAADRAWIRDRDGGEIWVVSVKATYDIAADGRLGLAAEQVPVFAGPIPDPTSGELRYDTDLGFAKSGTDIVLHGCAYSPDAKPVRELPIGFRVGHFARAAMVFGDRVWQKGLTGHVPGRPAEFVKMPLTYARALGGDPADDGESTGNPLGRGIPDPGDGDLRMPNVEDFDQRLSTPAMRPPVAAFGPVPAHWIWRRRHAGTYDRQWFERRRPLLPDDVDERSWRIAPPPQQLDRHLQGGETVVLRNLTRPGYCPDSRLSFELPRLSLGFETRFFDGCVERSRARIHTVILEPEWPRVSIVHHISLPCHPRVNQLERTIVTEKRRPFDPACRPVGDQRRP